MNESDEDWKRRMNEATQRAAAEGRGDVADYLRLRQVNDEARARGMSWLFDTFTSAIGQAVRAGASITAERNPAHRFALGAATMVGTSLIFRRGVRSLTIEAGYPRAPGDGFISGGGLARAAVRHFGDARSNVELLLASSGADEPQWCEVQEGKRGRRFTEREAADHVAKLLAMP